MFFRSLAVLVMVFALPSTALSHEGHHRPAPWPPCMDARYASTHQAECRPVAKRVTPSVRARVVLTGHVSASHRAAQAAILAPPPPVADMSGYNTGLFVAPAGTPYPLTEPKPGDYICTSTVVPLDTKVPGMHSPKPYAPCGYKWAYDSGPDKGFWHLVPDAKYGVRR